MEVASLPGVRAPEICMDFSFGFDNVCFSDRTLMLEIIDEEDTESEAQPDDNRNVKRRRRDHTLNNAIASRVKTIHVSSLILAARSSFFRKLFSNGMRESEERQIKLLIKASEEVPFMDLLNYVYGNNIPRTTMSAVLDVLVIADKFEVASCFTYCTQLLRNIAMTCESALLYLDLPSSLSMSHAIQPLIDAAKKFLAAHFKDVNRFKDEVLNLPLAGIQAVLSSDGLQVISENSVYDLVLEWAHKHYPSLDERREILRRHLLCLVRFPFLTAAKLQQVLTCTDIDYQLASKIVIGALLLNAGTPHRQHWLATRKCIPPSSRCLKRAYKFHPVKLVEFKSPHQQCIVYLDLKREEVTRMFPSGHIYSENFYLVGQELILYGRCNLDKQTNVHHFELCLGMKLAESAAAYRVNCEIALRLMPSKQFISKARGSHVLAKGPAGGSSKYLFGVPWSVFVADDSPYFINGILHLRADFTFVS